MELKFVNNSYFKQLFQNLRSKLQYSKNRIFVTSHFGTLLRPLFEGGAYFEIQPKCVALVLFAGSAKSKATLFQVITVSLDWLD